jgi:enoyl-CoA hydratase/carnithine racemase
VSASWSRSGDVYELCLDHAPCNEIGLVLLERLEQFLDEVSASNAKAVIAYSARPLGFSAGADLRGLYSRMEEGRHDQLLPELQDFVDRIHALANRLDALPQTTFAAVHGVCFGGGFELALLFDVLIADRSSRFAFPELRLGIIPGFGGLARLKREVPNAVMRDVLLTGRSINATRAHALGLVSQLVGSGQALNTARAAARHACLFDTAVVAAAKSFIKPPLLEELELEKAMFMRMIVEPRVRAALADFVSRTDPLPYLPRDSRVGEDDDV